MTARELAELVAQMRRVQAAYFRERLPADLDEARRLERAVDLAVRDILQRQQALDLG